MENNTKQNNTIKNRLLAILLAVVSVSVAVLMWIAIFGNGSGGYVIFESVDEFQSVTFTQSNAGVVDKTTKANVKITSGDKFFVTSNGANGKEMFECEILDGKLLVTLQTKQDILGEFFSSEQSEIIISIPKDMNLKSLDIKADFAFFEIENVKSESFVFEGESTVANIANCNFVNSKISSQLGNIRCFESDFGETNFEGGTTNPEFKGCNFENFNIHVKFGNILLENASVKNVDFIADMGYVNINEISLQGDMKGYSDYGAINLSIVGDPKDFAVVSRISESGKTIIDENIKVVKDESLLQLDLSTYIGDIVVEMI